MNYFNTFLDICKGVRCFPMLSTRSMWLVAWHFLLTMVICSIIITVGRQPALKSHINTAKVLIAEEFGTLSNAPEGGIVISKNPAESRSMLLPAGFSLCYLTSTLPEEMPKFEKEAIGGFIFSPVYMALWLGEPQNSVYLLPVNANNFQPLNVALSDEAIKQAFSRPPTTGIAEENLTSTNILHMLYSNSTTPAVIILWCTTFFELIILALPSLLLFILVFGWFGQQRTAKLITLRECFVISFYASLPVMLVASMFPALKLPYLDFQMVFLFGTIIYTFIAVNFVAANRYAVKIISEKFGEDNDEK